VPGTGDGFHQLRHLHTSQLIAGYISLVAVAYRLGHKDADETLSTHSHLWHDDDSRAAARTDGMFAL
jgi:integrase